MGLRNQNPKFMNLGVTVWIPPDEEHCHGATTDNSMVHIAIQEEIDGKVANWMEQVLDSDYYI